MLLLPLLALLTAAPVEDKEPALVFYFDAENGKRVPVELDKPFPTTALGKTATLRLEPNRRFAFAGLEFNYPREYTFEADLESPAFSQWTLSGNDCKVMIQRYKAQKNADTLHKSVVAEIKKAYGTAKTTESVVKLEAGGRTFEGTRLEVEIAGTAMVQDLFPLKIGNDTLEIVIQDSPKKAGQASADRARAEGLLKESLKVPAK